MFNKENKRNDNLAKLFLNDNGQFENFPILNYSTALAINFQGRWLKTPLKSQ